MPKSVRIRLLPHNEGTLLPTVMLKAQSSGLCSNMGSAFYFHFLPLKCAEFSSHHARFVNLV